MAERNSWAVSDSPNGVITTEDARLAVSALGQAGPSSVTVRNGLRPGSGDPGMVLATAPTPDGTVNVQPFQMFMRASRGIGSYVQTLDTVKTLDLLTANPAHPTNTRYDLIIAQQADKFYGDTSNEFVVRQVVGGESPNITVPGSPDFFLLAIIQIPAGATTITQDLIEDRRPGWVVGLGGIMPARGADDRDATETYDGLTVYRQDRRWLEIHDGTRWRVPSMPVCSSLNEITVSITDPLPGQLAFSTADNLVYRWSSGTGWVGAVATGGTTTATRHEARYEVRTGQAQTFPQSADTRISFPTAVYTSPDITASANNSVFTLNRGGIWAITTSQRLNAPGGADNHFVSLSIVDSVNINIRHGNMVVYYPPSLGCTMHCATTSFFAAGSQVSALILASAAANRTHIFTHANVNNICLTWLRP